MTEAPKRTFEQPLALFASGSRTLDYKHVPLIKSMLLEQRGEVWFQSPVIIHGAGRGVDGAPGFDKLVDIHARASEYRVLPIPALWEIQGKVGGPIRNRLCAEILLAHARAGYWPVFRGFSTGGPGTENAYKVVLDVFEKAGRYVDAQKIDVPPT